MKSLPKILCLILIATSAGYSALHAEEPVSIESVINKDVIAVATVDLTQVKLPQIVKWAIQSGLVPEADAGKVKFSATAAQGAVSALVDSGVERISVLLRLEDLQTKAPMWVASIADSKDTEEAMEALSSVADMLPVKSNSLAVKGRLIVGGPDQTTVDQWAVDGPQRSDFDVAWKGLLEHQVGLAVFGNKDMRRVVREMLPSMPSPFEEATGELVADHISWAGMQINLPPNIDAQVLVQSTDPESAKACQRLVTSITKYSVSQTDAEFRDALGQLILDGVKPVVDKNRVRIDLNSFLKKETLTPMLAGFRAANAGPQRQNNLRQVCLALLNYTSAKQSFPPLAIYSDAGRPLLSWRVALLPYLDRQDLYEKFRLDERWDSPHNLKVSRDMPDFYQDPENEHHNVNLRTMVQLPYGDGVMFQGQEGTKFSDIKDGTSNTIAVVHTNPAKAVYWTKPADWEVDLDHPWDGLKRDNDQTAVVSFADGSTHAIDASMPEEDLRAMLTREGGEVISR